ncbi:MAG: hypothetical protein NC307_11245 [Roseburia sp.]|nr:hypothetical protein [Roseburia sp.]
MFEKFCDYMYYLLTSPFKRIKKKVNQWYILFRVLGRRFDDAMEDLYDALEQTMAASCDPVMLPVHAAERRLVRYQGEEDENFRKRISSYMEVLKLGGSNPGVLLAAKSLGYDDIEIIRADIVTGDKERWAEFFVIIQMSAEHPHPISFPILVKNVRKAKAVGAKDNYLFRYQTENDNKLEEHLYRIIIRNAVTVSEPIKKRVVYRIRAVNENIQSVSMVIIHDAWRFDGEHRFNGEKTFSAYIKEDLL